ncbi:MAG: Molybdopterin molybdenumtransferase [Synergistetes bacterium ADurb.Bin520]|nr:MAG: Molybdopterin molybdenumtransferase [Synergistetes bacterium ADurb.Bin520]
MPMVKDPPQWVTLSECWSILRREVGPALRRDETWCSPEEALDRPLTRDVVAQRNVPHFRASAVDGFALRSEILGGASPTSPVFVRGSDAVWCNTGAPVPSPYDAVVMVEDVTEDPASGGIRVHRALPPGTNVRAVGEDAMAHRLIARQGDRVTPALAALCVAAGVGTLPVRLRMRVTYIPTGDEIVAPDRWLATTSPSEGLVGETNSLLLKGYLNRWGVQLTVVPVVADDPTLLAQALQDACAGADVVVLGAGTAKGDRDHAASVLSSQGRILFRGLRLRPGRPAMMGIVGEAPVLCLPGFPLSAAVVLWSVLFPLIRLFEEGDFSPETVLRESLGASEEPVSLLIPHSSPQGVAEWVRLQAVEIDDKRWAWVGTAGASVLTSLADADGLALIPPEALELPKGTPVVMWRTRDITWKSRILFQGSDDPGVDALRSFVRRQGGDMAVRGVGSLGGLAALRRGEGHAAACHLLDETTGEYNDAAIAALQPEPWDRRLLYWRTQGLIVSRGNPKGIERAEDLGRAGVTIANRQPGAGTRVLLDYLLKKAGVSPEGVRGYDVQCTTHLEGAARVASGMADAVLGLRAAAEALDLDFVPLAEEPFELVIPSRYLSHPGILALFRALEEPSWKRAVEAMGGYRWPS